MNNRKVENKNFDITRRDQLTFRHYQILVKVLNDDKTERHNLEVFTTGPAQLIEMRRVYAKTQRAGFRTLYNILKNN